MNIPDDILSIIFFMTEFRDYPNIACTSRGFSQLLLAENLLRRHCNYDQITKPLTSYRETIKAGMTKWYTDDMGKITELRKNALLKIANRQDKKIYAFGNKLNSINNKLTIKLLAPLTYVHIGFFISTTGEHIPDWDRIGWATFTVVGENFFYLFDSAEFAKVKVDDYVTISIDYENSSLIAKRNNEILSTKNFPMVPNPTLIPYVIVNRGEVQLL